MAGFPLICHSAIGTHVGDPRMGRMAAKVHRIGSYTGAEILETNSEMPRISPQVVRGIASCCAQSVVPVRRKWHCRSQQVKLVFLLKTKTRGKVKPHFELNKKVMVLANRRNSDSGKPLPFRKDCYR